MQIVLVVLYPLNAHSPLSFHITTGFNQKSFYRENLHSNVPVQFYMFTGADTHSRKRSYHVTAIQDYPVKLENVCFINPIVDCSIEVPLSRR